MMNKKPIGHTDEEKKIINIIRSKLTPPQYHGYLLGSSIEHTERVNFKVKSPVDMEKLKYFKNVLTEYLSEKTKYFSNSLGS